MFPSALSPQAHAVSITPATAVLNCPPCQADEASLKFQHPLVVTLETFPVTDNKMDQSRVGLRTAVVDKILEKVFRGTAETRACFREVSSQGRGIRVDALFPGFRYVVPPDRDMVAEVKRVAYLVAARDEQGNVILKDNGEPLLIECGASPARSDRLEQREDKKWRCDFITKLRNPAINDFLKKKNHPKATNFWQIASVIEAKWMLDRDDIYHAGWSGCNEVLREFRLRHPVDRLYCFVWGKEYYAYGILDGFGFVIFRDHKIDPASFERYLQGVEEMKTRLGVDFPLDSYQKVPQTMEKMQAYYDDRKTDYEVRYDTSYPGGVHQLLVGVYYCDPAMCRRMVTGNAATGLTDAYQFIQGFMRVHVGNEFLGWNPETVESVFRRRLIEIRKEERELFTSRFFERDMLLYSEEMKRWTESWLLEEKEDGFTVTLNIPDFAGRVSFMSGAVEGDLASTGMDVLRIYRNSTPVKGEHWLGIVFPFSSIEMEGIHWDSTTAMLVICLPKKEPLVGTERPVKKRTKFVTSQPGN